jgi:hypothetical protein
MFEPREVEVTTFWDAGEEHYSATKRPLVTLWADDFFRGLHPPLTPEMLGYRHVLYCPERRSHIYARPWTLWGLLWLREKMRRLFWATASWLWKHGFIHMRTPLAQCTRWRDLGLGPTPRGRGLHEPPK